MDLQQIFDNLGFDWRMALFSTINFLLVFVILRQFLFKRVGDVLTNRKNYIEESIKRSEEYNKRFEETEKERADIIKAANDKANDIVAKAKIDAEELSEQKKSEANAEADKIISKAKEQADRERGEMISTLKKETADLAIMATEKIIEKELDQETDKKIIDEYLDTLDA